MNMNDTLFQAILGHSLIVGLLTVIITLGAGSCTMVCEIEGWDKSASVFRAITNGSLTIGVICVIVIIVIGVCMTCNDLYCDIVCAS